VPYSRAVRSARRQDNGDDGCRSHPFGSLLAVSHRVFQLSDASGGAGPGSAAQARGSVVGFESALLKRAKNFSFRGCIRRPRESLLGRGYRPARRATASRRACPSTAGDQGKRKVPTPLHSQSIAHCGACGKTRVVPHNRRPRPELAGKWSREVRVVLSAYGSRGDVEPLVGLAVRLRSLGAEVRVARRRTARSGWPRSACR
jgi:hypothetical protein